MDLLGFSGWQSAAGNTSALPSGNDMDAAAQTAPQFSLPTGNGASISPTSVLIGLIVLLIGLKLLGESDISDINPAHFHIGAYNVLTVTVTAALGIVIMKVIFNKYHVPGVTDVINTI